MNDKEKEINEMAKVMCGNDCEECAKESANFYGQTLEEARNNKCLLKNCAKTLYERGYRNCKDKVVLSKEELNTIQANFFDGGMEYTRKEMQEELAKINKLNAENIKLAKQETARDIINEFAKMLIGDFTKSADIQDFITIKQTLRDICPAKVNKIKKKLAKQYGVEVE